MAHTQIKGLASYPFDVDFFSNEIIIGIEGEFGAKGVMTVVALLCAIYRKGYYAEWQADLKYRLRREICGVSPQFLEMVCRTLVRRGFFDKKLFDSDSILTSADIQRRYFGAAESSPRDSGFPYVLLSEDVFSPDRADTCLSSPKKGSFCGDPPTPPLVVVDDNNNLNYINITTTERKVNGGVGERENPPGPVADIARDSVENFCSNGKKKIKNDKKSFNETKQRMEGFITELKTSPVWGESVCRNNRIDPAVLPQWLDSFLLFCLSEGVEHGSLREMKSHFNRWLPKRIENLKTTTTNESDRQDKSQRRRQSDTSAKSAGDYSTSF